MTEKEMNTAFEVVFRNLTLKTQYAEVCKIQSDFENRAKLTKEQAQKLKAKCKTDLKIASREKMFYQDYFIQNIQIRLMIPYGHGLIDSSYRVFKGMSDNSIPSFSYRKLAESNQQNENDTILTFPTNTNMEEYESTLKLVLKMNDEIMKSLKAVIENK